MSLGTVLLVIVVLALLGVLPTWRHSRDNVEPITLTVKDKETVNVPAWAGVIAILLGGVLLSFQGAKRI